MIADSDGLLVARFAAIRDASDDSDWRDVVRRSAPQRQRRRRAFTLAFAAVVLLVPTAFAFGAVRDFFFGTPAPPLIKGVFAKQNAIRKMLEIWDRTHHVQRRIVWPEVNGNKAHGVLAVNTTDGPLLLWAAPAAHATQCWFVEFARDQVGHKRATGGGGCDSAQPPTDNINWGYGWAASHPSLNVLSGRVYVVGATTLDVTAADKTTSATKTYAIPVVHRYFLAVFPRAIKVPTKLVARDAKGHILATYTSSTK